MPRSPASGDLGYGPGHVLVGRYRIVGLLGRGGMGEVYRADDLKLGMPVALKFLPRRIEHDADALDQLLAEVRTARQVSHPHVCRVYDVDVADGRHFISMEYIDGEDLAGLLHRIGRLPPAKALESARQICAGLAAAHDKGVLHRDLKPANVMIDGHGRARLTDFGVAVLGADAKAEVAGTPAYMAPEQLQGRPATVRSDIYALGLVLYEIFTGKPPFSAYSFAEWRHVHERLQPASPSTHTGDMDPAVDRVILRCLEKDAAKRPASATQVALALPGGDPLAAAIAAGETPSPGMVAAAGGEGALAPTKAWTLLAAFLLCLAAVAALSPYATDLGLAPMDKSPDTLRDRAREVMQRFGYTDRPADEAAWLERDYAPLHWLAEHQSSVDWRKRLAVIGPPVLLTYRVGPEAFRPVAPRGSVTVTDPPAEAVGSVRVVVDARGRLREMQATPPRVHPDSGQVPAFPEDVVFQEAGLDRARFQPVPAEWVPPVPFDARREWMGSRADTSDIALRVSAATFDGRLVAASVVGPWNAPSVAPLRPTMSATIEQSAVATCLVMIVIAGAFFARRNLRLGRGDRAGAFRVAVVYIVLAMLYVVPGAHLFSSWYGLVIVQTNLWHAIGAGVLMWMLYIALEPFVRRRIPELLVGWARVLEGRVRDPRVGSDVLTGLAAGALVGVLTFTVGSLPTFFPISHETPVPWFAIDMSNRMVPMAVWGGIGIVAIFRSVGSMALLFFLHLLLRRTWAAGIGLGVLFTLFALGSENPMLETPVAIVMGTLFAIVTTRAGLLAFVTLWIGYGLLVLMPIGIGFNRWYGPYAWLTPLLLVVIAVGAFITSLGGRSAFGNVTLDA